MSQSIFSHITLKNMSVLSNGIFLVMKFVLGEYLFLPRQDSVPVKVFVLKLHVLKSILTNLLGLPMPESMPLDIAVWFGNTNACCRSRFRCLVCFEKQVL